MKSNSGPRRVGRPLSFDRAEALRQAMTAFWRHGYETTSVSDLTMAMGISAPSLYAAFGDKKQLFLESMRLYAGSLDGLRRTLDAAPTARAAVVGLLTTSARAFTGDQTPKGCLLASAAASGSRDMVDVQRAVANVRADIRTCLERRIAKDVDLGILNGRTTPDALAVMVIALIQGMSVLARDGMDRESLLRMIDVTMAAWPVHHDGD